MGDASWHIERGNLDETTLSVAQFLFEESREARHNCRNLVNKAPPYLCGPNRELGTAQGGPGNIITARPNTPSEFEKFTWMSDP